MAGAMTTTRKMDSALTFNLIEQVKGQALAQAGVEYAVFRLLSSSDDESIWRPETGRPFKWQFDHAEIIIQAQDVRGLIDINRTNPKVIQSFFETMGKNEEEAQALVDIMQDFRDQNQDHRLNGMEDEQYESLGLSYGAKDKAFQSIEELKLLPTMTDKFFQIIKPYLTLRNQTSKVSSIYAPEAVLRALPALDEEQVETILTNRNEDDDTTRKPVGRDFRIQVEVHQGALHYTAQAEVALKGRKGFYILAWTVLPVKKLQPVEEIDKK